MDAIALLPNIRKAGILHPMEELVIPSIVECTSQWALLTLWLSFLKVWIQASFLYTGHMDEPMKDNGHLVGLSYLKYLTLMGISESDFENSQ